jgi:hypothetical protein
LKQDIRELIIEELKKDLIGPRISDDETFWEYEGDKPTSRYITGALYPKQTKLDQDDFLKNTAEGESDEDEEVEQTSSFTTATGTYPSSLGITCSILLLHPHHFHPQLYFLKNHLDPAWFVLDITLQ